MDQPGLPPSVHGPAWLDGLAAPDRWSGVIDPRITPAGRSPRTMRRSSVCQMPPFPAVCIAESLMFRHAWAIHWRIFGRISVDGRPAGTMVTINAPAHGLMKVVGSDRALKCTTVVPLGR